MEADTEQVNIELFPTSKSQAVFTWTWAVDSNVYVETVTCRVDHLKTRGVPIPIKLGGHVNVYELKHAASDAAASLDKKDEGKLDHITCECSPTLYGVCARPDIDVAMAHNHLASATA